MGAERFFEGFTSRDVEVDGVSLHAVVGGSGPPVLLVHGAPQSCVLWRKVAPALARSFTVVAADLRGYGRSAKPETADYSKRRMARDLLELMRVLGFERFHLAGHDRGGRVARRFAKDHPAALERLAIIDIAPTAHVFANVDRAVAGHMWHWFFLSQKAPLPETLMGPQAAAFVRNLFGHGGADPEALDDYAATNGDPAAFHAMCEDYRAGAGVDLEHDAADEGLRIEAPALILWGERSFSTGRLFDMPAAWSPELARPTFRSLPCGHFVPEEMPEETAQELLRHFSQA